jgi:preprotein translocase subunit SecD
MSPFPLEAVLFWIAITLAPPDTSQIVVKGPDATRAWTKQASGWSVSTDRSAWVAEGNTVTTSGTEKNVEDVGRFVEGVKDHGWNKPEALKLQPGASLAKEGETFVYTLDEGTAAAKRYVIRFRRDPAGPVMIYEQDPPREMSASAWDDLLKAIDRRLNSGSQKLARVRKGDHERIEVALLRGNEADQQRVDRLLAQPDTVEFRVLASNHQDKAVIEQARKDPSKAEVLDPAGKKLAWWAPVMAGADKNIANDSDIVRRTKEKGDRDITEVLVVADSCNVTGAYVMQAKAEANGEYADINITFNDAGGKLLAKLTGDHISAAPADFRYGMGVILNGELCTAPRLQAPISNDVRITGTGSFPKDQVSELVDILNSGSLPSRLRLVPAVPKGPPKTPAETKDP